MHTVSEGGKLLDLFKWQNNSRLISSILSLSITSLIRQQIVLRPSISPDYVSIDNYLSLSG